MTLTSVRQFRSFVALAAVIASVSAAPAVAAPVIFTDEAAFNAAVTGAGLAMRQDGFEGLPTGFTGSLDREGFSVRGTFPNPSRSLFVDAQFATEGTNVLIAPFTLPVIFDFDQPVRAFSVDLIDNFTFPPASYSLSLNGGPAETLFELPLFELPRPRVVQFLGIFDPDGISSLALSNFHHIAPDVTASMIRMDRVRYEDTSAAPVPEPSLMLLLGAGLTGLARRLRRSSR